MSGLLILNDCIVDLDLGVVARGTKKKSLTRKESALLSYLAARPGELITRGELLEKVWGYRSGARTNTVGTTIWSLRSKVERDRRHPTHLLTRRGGGYCFVPLRRADPLKRYPHGSDSAWT